MSEDLPLVSIVIPCRSVDSMTRECVSKCLELDYDNFEIIVLPDSTDSDPLDGARVVPTGPASPGLKRNIGSQIASGEVLAYTDSDAYPRRDWLRRSVSLLRQQAVGAVGGPGLTPPEDSSFAQAQGAILASSMVSGGISSRYRSATAIDSDDIHSVNLVAWRRAIEGSGGWNEQYWPGEDTLLCLSLKKSGYRMLLAPDIVVYHHRRSSWSAYFNQIRSYGIHRGFFAKRFPENSMRPAYFLPSLMLVGLVIGLFISALFPLFRLLMIAVVAAYFVLLLVVAASDSSNFLRIVGGIPVTHFAYGIGFMEGLATRSLRK